MKPWSTILFGLVAVVANSQPVSVQELKNALPKVWERMGAERFTEIVSKLNEWDEKTQDSPFFCNGRLSLTASTPVTTADVNSGTTIYFSPYQGNRVSLYNGSRWKSYHFNTVSVAVPSTTVRPFDIFGYSSSGTLALQTVNWTNDTTRATALTTQDGIYVSSSDSTKRYLGTARTSTNLGEVEDTFAQRFVWNNCNRLKRVLRVRDLTNAWSYQSATWRAANGSTANRVEVIIGLAESFVNLIVHESGDGYGDTSAQAYVAIGEDSTSSPHANTLGQLAFENSDVSIITGISSLRLSPSVGYHYYQWLEKSGASANVDFYGQGTCGAVGVTCMFTGINGWISG